MRLYLDDDMDANVLIRFLQEEGHEVMSPRAVAMRGAAAEGPPPGGRSEPPSGIAGGARRAGACRYRGSAAARADLAGLTRGTRHAVWPAPLADGLIALHIINEIRDIDLQHWTPVRGLGTEMSSV